MRRLVKALAWSVGMQVAAVASIAAQDVRGTVRESSTNQPISGAVITLLTADGKTLGRNITDEQGRYRMVAPREAVQLRFVRIGFRPALAKIPHTGAAVDTVDVLMTTIPTLLDPVTVAANACPRRSDAGSALGLLEQARASLLNSVVSRDANPAALVLIRFQRFMDGMSDRIERQVVKIDSTSRSKASFAAVRSGSEFVGAGFVREEAGSRIFYAPDAESLLDEAFIAGYCFRIVKPNADHPSEVGLGFATPGRARDRVDVDGVLWVDTTRRQLRRLEFKYVGLERALDAVGAGGSLSFHDMPNGVVMIDRWSLRLPSIRQDSLYDNRTSRFVQRSWVEAQETGGEVARAKWKDQSWDAPLSTLRVRAFTHAKKPAVGTRVWLEDTDYTARTDANGDAVLGRLIPGPYKLVVIDSLLEPLGITLKTPVKLYAGRDSVYRATLDVPTANDFVEDRCRHDGIWKVVPRRRADAVWMIGRVLGADDAPLQGVAPTAAQAGRAEIARDGMFANAVQSTRTGTDGIFEMCPTMFIVGDTARVRITQDGVPLTDFVHKLADTLTVLPLIRQTKRP